MTRAFVGLAVCVLSAVHVRAQAQAPAAPPPATRAEALEAARTAREQHLTIETHGLIERALIFVEEKRVLARLNPPQGFYPSVGSIARGSGAGVGLGYRRRPLAGRLVFDTSAAITFRAYTEWQVTASAPRVGGLPLEFQAGTRWYDYTQEDFFGLGSGTRDTDRVSFGLTGRDTFGQVMARRAGWFVMRGRAGLHRLDVSPGTDPRFPSLEERFTGAAAPGLDDVQSLAYAEAGLSIDTRDEPGNTRGGGLYNLSVGVFRDRGPSNVDVNRIDVTAMHVIPIFDKKRGIALHAAASRIDPVGESHVPFFLMPTVGGADSLRGYREFRFRDAAAVTLNAEYRWEAFSALDLALFVDAADVGPTWRSLVGARLKSSWGMGVRFNTNRRVFLRIDVAGGREGPRIWTALGPVFRRR
jgi:opacity protein-like surface antigen